MEKITIYFKPAKGYEGTLKEIGTELTLKDIQKTLAANGWEYKVIENDKFETESEGWNDKQEHNFD